jgi:hypothetical protein
LAASTSLLPPRAQVGERVSESPAWLIRHDRFNLYPQSVEVRHLAKIHSFERGRFDIPIWARIDLKQFEKSVALVVFEFRAEHSPV